MEQWRHVSTDAAHLPLAALVTLRSVVQTPKLSTCRPTRLPLCERACSVCLDREQDIVEQLPLIRGL